MNTEFKMFITKIKELSEDETVSFSEAVRIIQSIIFSATKESLMDIVSGIGSIPESIEASSSEEKLYSKASDIVLAKCFEYLGIPASVLKERANSADILARSSYHGYTFVADAKTFRLSRTAKNQKDFKIEALE